MKVCASCNIQYEDERKFCRNCGKPLAEVSSAKPEKKSGPASAPSPQRCPSCGEEVTTAGKFCPSCGTVLATTARPPREASAVVSSPPSTAESFRRDESVDAGGLVKASPRSGKRVEPKSAKTPESTIDPASKSAPSQTPQKGMDRTTVIFLAVCVVLLGGLILFRYFKLTPRSERGSQNASVGQSAPPVTTPAQEPMPASAPPDVAVQPSQPAPVTLVEPPKPKRGGTGSGKTAVKEAPASLPTPLPEPVQPMEPAPSPPIVAAAPQPTPAPAPEAAPPPKPALMIPAQMRNERIEAKLLQTVAASTSRKGERIRAEVIAPGNLAGALMNGEVTSSKASGKLKGKSELAFGFYDLSANGATVPITANVTAIQNSEGKVDVDEEGHLLGKPSKGKDALRAGIMGGIGAVIGGIFGGKKGAGIGAGVGTAVGLAWVLNTTGEDIRLGPGSVLSLEVSTQTENAKNQ